MNVWLVATDQPTNQLTNTFEFLECWVWFGYNFIFICMYRGEKGIFTKFLTNKISWCWLISFLKTHKNNNKHNSSRSNISTHNLKIVRKTSFIYKIYWKLKTSTSQPLPLSLPTFKWWFVQWKRKMERKNWLNVLSRLLPFIKYVDVNRKYNIVTIHHHSPWIYVRLLNKFSKSFIFCEKDKSK